MSIPGTPQNVYVQQNGAVLISWDSIVNAINYSILKSTDGINFTQVALVNFSPYLDSAVTVGEEYWYAVAAVNASGTGSPSEPQSIVPAFSGQLSLGQLRLMAQQRADRVGSSFVTIPEWNTYIVQSYFELYDLLITVYEDYFLKAPYIFQTDGQTNQYPLPQDFYKLWGVDFGLAANDNAWVTVKKFDAIARNRFVFPSITSTYLGVFNLQYRLVGNNIWFIPTPSAGQFIRMWYIPKLVQPLADTDILDGLSGWLEYVICDAAIKALQKEESDVSVLMAQKQMLQKRIEESSMNRDVGMPDTISNTRTWSERFGGFGGVGFDGGFGGF